MITRETTVVIIGGGPGGYEAALVAAQLGAKVTIIERLGVGGAAVLTDCVPSKALIAIADYMSDFEVAGGLGVRLTDDEGRCRRRRRRPAAHRQRADPRAGSGPERRHPPQPRGRRRTDHAVGRDVLPRGTESSRRPTRGSEEVTADVILVATGATPRVLPTAVPDGERILTWQQIYSLTDLPERIVVIGSGVTGAELAQAFLGLGSEVVLVSSRDRVLPGGGRRRGDGDRRGFPQARDGGAQPVPRGGGGAD